MSERDDPKDLWLRSPCLAYAQWVTSRRVLKREFNKHSIRQYQCMFNGFLRWLGETRGRVLLEARTQDIDAFLGTKGGRNGSPASATTRRRYLHLVEGVYAHLVDIGLLEANPAGDLLEASRHQDFQRPAPIILSEALMERFVRWCVAQPKENWFDLRDNAMRLLFLASGITVCELQALHPKDLKQLSAPATMLTLDIEAHGFVPDRVAPVAAFARPALLAWAKRLEAITPDSEFLFPAREYGFTIDRPDNVAISSPECYTIVQTALNSIGYERQRQGPQTLRNSFIAHQVWKGREFHRITQWVGLRTNETVSKIARLVPVRRDGVVPA